MTKVRVRSIGERYVYIHLSNAAYFFKMNVEEKKKNGGEGIGLDCMACLIMLAFAFEAKINFLGAQFLSSWKEKSPFKNKLKKVFEAFGIQQDENARPYSSIILAKEFRDTLAHGKPIKEKFDEIVEGTPEEFEKCVSLVGDWEQHCKPDTVYMVYEDVDTLWNQLMTAAKLELWDTLTRGQLGVEVIERLADVNGRACA